MDRALLAQIWPVFSAEAREHLAAIASGLVALGEEPGRADVLEAVRRTAHSLKGSAGSLGLGDVEALAHGIEGALAGADGGAGISPATVRAALFAIDALGTALATADAGGEARVERLGVHLSALGESRGPGAAAPAASRAPAEAPPQPDRPAPAASPAGPALRVPAATLDAISRQLDLLSLAEARHARRARELREAEGAVRELQRALDQVARGLGAAGADRAQGEVVAAAARLRHLAGALAVLAGEGQRDAETQELAASVLREDLRALRTVPAGLALEPLRRAVGDVAERTGKEVELELSGADVRLDRRVVEALREPLLHLVRNAVDHGLEDAAARRAAGKPGPGRVSVRVEPRGSRVGVVVEDDGAGLDLARVRASAVAKGLLAAEAAAALPDAEAARLVFHPGLSTARVVTAISGRGVGLDAVRDAVTRLGGLIDVSFAPGRGTRFDLELPLTVAAVAAVTFRFGADLAALPADAVERVLLLAPDEVTREGARATVSVAGVPVPFAPLAAVLGLAPPAPSPGRTQALVVVSGAHRVALGVDEVLAQQEVAVSPLGARVAGVAHLAGGAILDDGRVVGVLAAAELVRRARGAVAPRPERRRRVVVADDSLSTRTALRALLERAGYEALTAADGEEAWRLLSAGADLLVSDVQMPRLDGIALTRRVRADPRLLALPVVLCTSLDGPEDRAAGLAAGATAFLGKREVLGDALVSLAARIMRERG